jgi:AcrR family transcriptional regulator
MARQIAKKKGAPPRRRRDPVEAKALILSAAERVFAEHVPDVVGLKEIAREAGVSHALVSHYFGSYEALVEATLERRLGAVRARVMEQLAMPDEERGAVLALVAEAVQDRLTLRLAAWAMLTGRAKRSDFFSARIQGLRAVADAIGARRSRERLPDVSRADIEFAIVATITMMLGFSLGREAFLGSLGHATTPYAVAAAEADFRIRVRELLEVYLATRRPALL